MTGCATGATGVTGADMAGGVPASAGAVWAATARGVEARTAAIAVIAGRKWVWFFVIVVPQPASGAFGCGLRDDPLANGDEAKSV